MPKVDAMQDAREGAGRATKRPTFQVGKNAAEEKG
jgi:hypothetical protein